jgi:catechol 2,3-dioxygenase-like lactoylglutathione lyase family enzyme
VDWTLEVVVLPVSDIDRSVAFYRDQVGFALDHDTKNEHMHVVQLTPPGSGCSIVFGDLPAQREMSPGSMRGLQLCVADAAAARAKLLERGVEASELMSFGDQDGSTFFGLPIPTATPGRCRAEAARREAAHPVAARGRFGAERSWPARTSALVRRARLT